jgi:hypothetical protein
MFKITRLVLVLAFVLTIAALTGCAHPIGHFTVVSDKNVSGLDAITTNVGSGSTKVAGESCRDFVLFIPVSSPRDLDEAFANAIQKSPGANALSDVTVKGDGLFTLFFNKQCFSVEGTPIKLGK